MSYQHGAGAEIGNDKVKSAVQVDTVVAYIGTAPINLVLGYKEKGLINTPIKLENMPKTQATVGYSSNWDKFTLCEPFDCHFANTIGNVGPIYIINVLDPAVHQKDVKTTVELTFKNGRAEYVTDTIILDTFALSDKVLGTDYSLDYNYTKGAVVIESLNDADPITGTVEASFTEVDPSLVTKDDIIGSVTASGKRTGLQALSKLYIMFNAVLNVLAAPFWSEDPSVYKAMVSAVQKLNGHWDGFVNADIPIYDSNAKEAVDTIKKAEEWADRNGYNNGFSKVCWPQVQYAGRAYHLSTQATVTMQRVDNSHNNIPMESPSNKEIMCTAQYFGANSENEGFDEQDGTELNSKGITTAIFRDGLWVLWGPHTAYFEYGSDGVARYIFDVNIRMLMYITNGFQRRHGTQIDGTMDLNLQQSVLIDEQEELDSLVGIGALIGNPSIPNIPMLATGGFTEGITIAGEAGTEAVISFDRSVRAANIGYWEKAGEMLGVYDRSETALAGNLLSVDDFSLAELSQPSTTIVYDFSGFTWSPVIAGGKVTEDNDDLMQRLKAHEAEFFDWLERWIQTREVTAFA